MNDKDIKNLYDNLEAPEELQNKILSAMNNAPMKKNKAEKIPLKRFILISTAVMLSLTMLVSAVAIVIHQTQYIPSEGFVDSGEYEVYYTPEVLTLGKYATVETVTRVQKGKTSDLSIIITDTLNKDLKVITPNNKEFDLTPTTEYSYSSFGTLGKFQFNKEGDYSSYGYFIKDFPDINEFTLVSGDGRVEVKLAPNNTGGVVTAEDSGVTMKFYSMAKGSKVLAYEIYEDNFNFEKILGITPPYRRPLELGPGAEAFKLYDENGNKIFLNGYDYNTGPDGFSTVMFLRTAQGKKISKMEVGYIGGSMSIYPMAISSIEDVPVPADGEEMFFDDGLLLYDSNGLTSKLTYIKRQGNTITIYTNTEYTGEYIDNIENINIYINWNAVLGSRMSGWTGNTYFNINGDEEFIKLYIDAIYYKINGNWEIDFE